MQTTLSRVAAAVTESCWLAALVVVPVFFNAHSFRTFEEDKIPLLRSLALVIVVALIVRACEEGRHAWCVAGQPLWRLPVVRAALGLTAAYGLSTLTSVAPRISFWGSYERMQGTYTWLSYVAVFLAIILLARTRQQLERLVTVVLFAGVAPAIYTIVQHFGYDPIQWGVDVTVRAHSTAGNPIFLAAYLIMLVPLTLTRSLARWRAGSRRARAAALVYLLLLTLQLLGLLYSQSRGPLIGLAVGLAVLFLVMALQQQRRRLTAAVIAVTMVAAVFVGVLNIDGGPLQALRAKPYLNLLARLYETGSGTGKVRVVIWEGAVNLLAASPWRDVVGYGPETLFLVYTPFYPPELARYESRSVAPDRAHNETFDALITTGAVGCAAELVLFVSLLSSLLQGLGLANTSARRRLFVALASGGAAMGMFAPYLVEGGFRYSGLCLALGIVAGLVLYLLVIAVRTPSRPVDVGGWRNLLFLGLLAGLLGHFVELQFGIAVGSTRLLFWTYAAVVVVVRTTWRSDDSESHGMPSAADHTAMGPYGFDLGLSAGLIMLSLTFNFYRPELDVEGNGAALLAMFLGTWFLGAVITATETADRPLSHTLRYSATSLGMWLVFTTVYVLWFTLRPNLQPVRIEQVLPAGTHLANCLVILYIFVFAVAALSAMVLVRREWVIPRPPYRRAWHVGFSMLLLLASVPVIVATNLDVSRADVFLKQIDFYTKQQQLDAALVVAEQARRLDSGIDQYATALVRVLMDLALAQPQESELYLPRAKVTMEQAQRRSPLNLDNTRNLARLHRLWAGLATGPEERQQHLDIAQDYYAHAVQLSSGNASLWNEWALLYVELRQPDQALRLINHSLEIDDGYTTTWWMRANLYLDTEAPERALADYNRALAIDPGVLAAWSGKALALARLNRLTEAIAANQEALKIAPNDLISHRNLALLYYQTRQPDLALQEAQTALTVAQSPQDKSDLEGFIRQIQEAANSG